MTKKNHALCRSGLFLLTLLVTIVFSYAISAESSGIWLPSSGGNCLVGQDCADWVSGGSSAGQCCIDPTYLYTSDFEQACPGGVRIEE